MPRRRIWECKSVYLRSLLYRSNTKENYNMKGKGKEKGGKHPQALSYAMLASRLLANQPGALSFGGASASLRPRHVICSSYPPFLKLKLALKLCIRINAKVQAFLISYKGGGSEIFTRRVFACLVFWCCRGAAKEVAQ